MRWEIKYYLSETQKRSKVAGFKEIISGDRRFAETWAKNKISHSNFVAFDIEQK